MSICCPEGPSTLHLSSLVPNTSKGMVVGTRDLIQWVLGPSGLDYLLLGPYNHQVKYPRKRAWYRPKGILGGA